jgi:hypothetical protein
MRFVRVPELTAGPAWQRYEPLGNRVVRYRSGGYQADLLRALLARRKPEANFGRSGQRQHAERPDLRNSTDDRRGVASRPERRIARMRNSETSLAESELLAG